MQETKPQGMDDTEAERLGMLRQELFTAKSQGRLTRQMEKRLNKLEDRGEELVRRYPVDADDIPAMAAAMTAQIANAHNKGQKRRLKKQLQKMIGNL